MTDQTKKYPPVIVVDENDHEIGSAMLAEVWQKGLYHRGVSIFVLDDQGRMLLQLRSPMWAFIQTAGIRRLAAMWTKGLVTTNPH